MGNITLMWEDARAVWIWPWLQSIWQDLAYAARGFHRQPGFTLIAIVALACATGLNTSLFTVFNAVALRPWAVKDPGRMVKVFRFLEKAPIGSDRYSGFSPAELRYIEQNSKTMSGMILTRGEGGLHLENARVRAEYVTGSFFEVLGVAMEQGRGFRRDEDRVDTPEGVAVLSYAAWQNLFGGDPGIISRRVTLEEVPFTIIGVASRDFTGVTGDRTDLWIPLASMVLLRPNDPWTNQFLREPTACCGDAAGRLAPGVTREQARAELSVLAAGFGRQLREDVSGVVLTGTPFLQRPGHKAREILALFGLMFAAVMLVLALTCANVGNLLLARAAARRKEIGIRLALGAGRRRLVRQFLTESLALGGAACVLGILLAYILPGPLFRMAVNDATFPFSPDITVLAFSIGLAVVTCIAFGLAPALHATSGDFSDALKDRPALGGPRLALRSMLLTLQVTASIILLISAGLLIRGINRARGMDPGFAAQDTASLSFEFPTSAYQSARVSGFYRDLAQGLERNPAVQPCGLTDIEPLASSRHYTGFRLPGESEDQSKLILLNGVSAGYFDVLNIPIVAGRNFGPQDAGQDVILVNQAMANRYFPGENAVGKTVVIDKMLRIVGVVRNAYTWGLDEIAPVLYLQVSYIQPSKLIVRHTPANVSAVEALARGLDSRVQMRVTLLSTNMDKWLSGSRAGALIAAMLGALALALATIGVSGVFAYAVQQRTQEIGIRMALGARPAQVTCLVLSWAGRSLLAGLALGLAGAIAASRLIAQYLFGLSSLDPLTYAAVILTLALAGLAAAYQPARRAIRVDPIRALRFE
jgi:predicted permease